MTLQLHILFELHLDVFINMNMDKAIMEGIHTIGIIDFLWISIIIQMIDENMDVKMDKNEIETFQMILYDDIDDIN